MILLRRVIGDALRARRQSQRRTLREVSTAANVSLGYLSEIERGQKEASSELLAAICEALGAQMSELLGEVSQTVAAAERLDLATPRPVPAPELAMVGASAVGAGPAGSPAEIIPPGPRIMVRPAARPAEPRVPVAPGMEGADRPPTAAVARPIQLPKRLNAGANGGVARLTVDGDVSVSVHQSGPFKATLRTTRNTRPTPRDRDVAYSV
jgi:transcriptional regulator with XRE-family HTH domain